MSRTRTLIVAVTLTLFAQTARSYVSHQWTADCNELDTFGDCSIYFDGHVAVGQTSGGSSVYTLLVADPTPNFALYATNGANPAYATFFNSAGNAYFGMEGAAGNRIIDAGGLPYALAFQAAPSRPIQFGAGGSTRLTILPSGNIGIGKTAPTVALDVSGDIHATGQITAMSQDFAEWVPSKESRQSIESRVRHCRRRRRVSAAGNRSRRSGR
jgi:hypothetical protein